MSTFTYLLAAVAVVAVLFSRAECRPQTLETRQVEPVGGDNRRILTFGQPVHLGEGGSVVGEILISTDSLVVDKKRKKKTQGGPSASALVAGPPQSSVGVSAGLTLVPSAATVELASAR